jgi:hypothetical protein
VLIHPTGVFYQERPLSNNPKAWYCFKSEVTVLSKTEIRINKNAHLASTKDQVTVLGKNNTGGGGVNVLGKTKVEKID